MSNFEKVKKFMQTFGQDVKNKPSFPSEKIINLRSALIEEELSELKEAVNNRNLTEESHLRNQRSSQEKVYGSSTIISG